MSAPREEVDAALKSCAARAIRYSLQLNDTVKVGQEQGILLTEGCRKADDVVIEDDVSGSNGCASSPC